MTDPNLEAIKPRKRRPTDAQLEACAVLLASRTGKDRLEQEAVEAVSGWLVHQAAPSKAPAK